MIPNEPGTNVGQPFTTRPDPTHQLLNHNPACSGVPSTSFWGFMNLTQIIYSPRSGTFRTCCTVPLRYNPRQFWRYKSIEPYPLYVSVSFDPTQSGVVRINIASRSDVIYGSRRTILYIISAIIIFRFSSAKKKREILTTNFSTKQRTC